MTWLLHNYFLPTINPSTVAPPQSTPLRSLTPVLKQYKSLRKIITRDASLRSQYQQEIKSVFKDVERWIAEATVSANVAVGELGWDTSAKGDQSAKEKWALERLCDALMEKGALVPLSKKYALRPRNAVLTLQVQKTRVPRGLFYAPQILCRALVASPLRPARIAS
jgi:ribosomal biogenesis protein LAS1